MALTHHSDSRSAVVHHQHSPRKSGAGPAVAWIGRLMLRLLRGTQACWGPRAGHAEARGQPGEVPRGRRGGRVRGILQARACGKGAAQLIRDGHSLGSWARTSCSPPNRAMSTHMLSKQVSGAMPW